MKKLSIITILMGIMACSANSEYRPLAEFPDGIEVGKVVKHVQYSATVRVTKKLNNLQFEGIELGSGMCDTVAAYRKDYVPCETCLNTCQ